MLLLGILVAGRRRLLTWVKTLMKRPYLVYCLVFTFTFIIAFSYIANFGILPRQRTQMLPLMLTIASMPAAVRLRPPLFGTGRWAPDRSPAPAVADPTPDAAAHSPATQRSMLA